MSGGERVFYVRNEKAMRKWNHMVQRGKTCQNLNTPPGYRSFLRSCNVSSRLFFYFSKTIFVYLINVVYLNFICFMALFIFLL